MLNLHDVAIATPFLNGVQKVVEYFSAARPFEEYQSVGLGT